MADASFWAISMLEVVVKAHILLGFSPLLGMFPTDIPKLLTNPLVRGFPGVWKLLLLHNSLPGAGLHP